MPKINLTVPHRLSQDEAKARISRLIADSRARFADKVSNVAESWNGYLETFSFDAMGASVSGLLDVQPSQVVIQANLPWIASPFKSRIESELATRAQQLLA